MLTGPLNTYQGLSGDVGGPLNGYDTAALGALGSAGSGYLGLANSTGNLNAQAAGGIGASGGYVAPASLGTLNSASTWKPDYASQAGVTAAQTAQQGRETLDRQLAGMGINPNSGRFAGLNQEFNLAAAAAKAGAMSAANRQSNQDWIKNLESAAGLGISNAGNASSAALGAARQNLSAESQQAAQTETGAKGLQGLAQDYGQAGYQYEQEKALKQAQLQSQLDSLFGMGDGNLGGENAGSWTKWGPGTSVQPYQNPSTVGGI